MEWLEHQDTFSERSSGKFPLWTNEVALPLPFIHRYKEKNFTIIIALSWFVSTSSVSESKLNCRYTFHSELYPTHLLCKLKLRSNEPQDTKKNSTNDYCTDVCWKLRVKQTAWPLHGHALRCNLRGKETKMVGMRTLDRCMTFSKLQTARLNFLNFQFGRRDFYSGRTDIGWTAIGRNDRLRSHFHYRELTVNRLTWTPFGLTEGLFRPKCSPQSAVCKCHTPTLVIYPTVNE